jgi:hypothetical protein
VGLSARPAATPARWPALVAAAFVSIVSASDAAAARRGKTRFDGIRDCERAAHLQLMRQNPLFRQFNVDRSRVSADRYAAQVGGRFVSTVYHGRATYDGGTGARAARFVCLHGGLHRRAVFFHLLPE